MVFYYKNKTYEVSEMVDIGGYQRNGIVVLFEIRYCKYEKGVRVWTKTQDEDTFLDMRFINYFHLDNWTKEELVEECKYFIDHEYDKNFDEGKYYMMEVRKALKDFDDDFSKNNDCKGSLDKLEYAQSDLCDYIKNSIPLDQNED